MARKAPARAVADVSAGYVGPVARRWLGPVAGVALAAFVADSVLVAVFPLLPFDEPLAEVVQRAPLGPLAYLMMVTNAIAGYWQLLVGAVLVLGLAVVDRRAGWLAAIGSLASLIDNLLKLSFERHRPSADLVHVVAPAAGYSYPSGHAVFFTWASFMVAFALSPRLGRRWRWLLWSAAGLVTFSGCTGRILVGAHWPSDVLGGFLLALFWCAFVLWLPERWLPQPKLAWLRRRPPAAAE